MPERTRRHAGRVKRSLGAWVIATALLSLAATSAASASLSGSMGGGARFPARSLVVSAPAGVPVTVPRIYVSENGKPVDYLSATPMKTPSAGDFGIVLVIDQSERMAGAPLAHAMAAARAIAAQRKGKQELGVITFDSRPSVVLPLTTDPGTIHRVLARTPWTGVGTSPLAAVMAALKQLSYAHIADGTVILLSDGADSGASTLTPASVGAAARAQHARIFTVELRDRSFAATPMRQIAQSGGGTFVAATGAQLPRVLTRLTDRLSQSYLLRYQSILSGDQHVGVTVHVDGMAKLLRLSYTAPALPKSSATSTPSNTTPTATTNASSTGSSNTASGGPTPVTKASGAKLRRAAPGPSSSHATAGKTSLPSWLTSLSSSTQGPGAAREVPSLGLGRSTVAGSVPTPAEPIPGWVPRAPRHSFWSSSLAVIIIAGSCALLIGLGLLVLLFRRPARRALRQRVGTFTLGPAGEPAIPTVTTEAAGPVAGLLTRRSWWPAFAEQVETARMKRSPLELVKRTAVIGAVAALLVSVVIGSVLPGLVLVIIAPLVLRKLVARGARRSQRRFNDQLPSHLQDLAGAMRGGRSFVGAMSAIVESANEPIRGEFDRAVSDERLGLPIEETLEAIGRRMVAKDMEQVALIASLNRKSGSNVAEALDRVAESARDRADLAREMRSLTGQARLSAWILTGMPPVLLVALTVMAPSYGQALFHTTLGIIMLVIAAGLLAAGWKVMNKITNPAT